MSIKKQFYDEGYIIIRNLINEELITNILDSLKEFKTKNVYYYTQSSHNLVKSSKITKEGFLIDSIQSPTKQKNCGELKFAAEKIISCNAISEILQEISESKKFVNWQNMLFDKSTGTIDHADTWYLDTKPRGNMIAAWIALEDINESAGRFFVYPKSHKLNIQENINKTFKDNYSYAKFMHKFTKEKNLKKFAPAMRKGDVLFWHPFTIHGSLNQTNKKFSRKSLTAHYHPVGFARIDTAEKVKKINSYIKNMRSSSNPYIYFDNDDPSDFEFTYISFSKWLIKKIFKRNKNLISRIMDREKIYNNDI